jgi:two-component system NtrC family sensor kinase
MNPSDDAASPWTRLFRCATPKEAEEAARSVGLTDPTTAVAIWRAHRSAAAGGEARLESRARDLETLQAFGRSLAEARSPDDVLARAAAGLQQLVDADAVAIAVALPERSGIDVHLSRALAQDDAALLRHAVGFGFVPVGTDPPEPNRLPGFDPLAGERRGLSETDVLVVPVARRGREIVRIGLVPRGAPDERCVRAVFGAANHVAVHLDRALAVAAAEQGRFRAILDSMPHAVLLIDGSFQIAHANAAAERLLAALGADPSTALRAVGDLDLVALSYDVLAGRGGEAAEAGLPEGRRIEVTVAPWQDAAGRVDGLVVVMLDVTTARRLRDQVTQSEKLSSLGRMIAGVAHELNNPLTSVIGYAQLLRSMPPGPKLLERLETIRKEADRCRRIVQNLLRFARTHVPEKRPFSLNEVVAGTAQLLAYATRSSGCRVALDLDRDLPSVVGDVHDIEQALVNLVANALQAMAGAGIAGVVTVTTRRDASGAVVVDVDDEGPGIPENARARVFDPFYTTKPAGQGTGLGLWLVYNAVASHGGSIAALPAPSGGARFRIALPAGPPRATARDAQAPDALDGRPSVSARILVLDTEAALAALICEALAGEGHDAVAAHDAGEALRRLEEEPFDLIVSDAELPGLPGERLASTLESVRPGQRRRILLTTTDAVTRQPDEIAARAGAGLLRKPFEIDELRRMVRTRLRAGPER